MHISFENNFRVLRFSQIELQRIIELYNMCINIQSKNLFNDQLLFDPISIIVIKALYELENNKDLIAIVPDVLEDITRYLVTKGQIFDIFQNRLSLIDIDICPFYMRIQLESFTDKPVFNCFNAVKRINIHHPFTKTFQEVYGIFQKQNDEPSVPYSLLNI